jgi:hypothetical protein
MREVSCHTCQADWGAGQFDDHCKECGGGAMDIACLHCGGECGNRWTRMVGDSHDRRRGHWIGSCAYPAERWLPILQSRLAASVRKSNRWQVPKSSLITGWLETRNASAVRAVHVFLSTSAHELRSDWRSAEHQAETNVDDHDFYRASVAWAEQAGHALEAIDPRSCPTVKSLLESAEAVFEHSDWSQPCPARESMAKRIDAVWRHGVHALELPLDQGDAPFAAL